MTAAPGRNQVGGTSVFPPPNRTTASASITWKNKERIDIKAFKKIDTKAEKEKNWIEPEVLIM